MRKYIRTKIAKYIPSLYPSLRDADVFVSCLLGRIHENEFRMLAKDVPKKSIVIDIGANLGQSVTSIARVCRPSEIIAFECNPNCINSLQRIGKINSLLRGIKFSLINRALGDFCQSFNFMVPTVGGVEYIQEGFLEGTIVNEKTIAARLKCDASELEYSIQSVKVEMLDSYNFNPGLIKIDVQGAELTVLKGALNTIAKCKPILLIELPDDIGERLKLLLFIEERLNYHVIDIGTNCLCKPKIK